MKDTVVLIPGPLVRASSWNPTARLLDARFEILIPDVVTSSSEYPLWADWAAAVKARLPDDRNLTLVGHSSASVIAAQLSTAFPSTQLIIVDGLIPPSSGDVLPVPPRIFLVLDALADQHGMLPPWSQWWTESPFRDAVGINALARQPALAAEVESNLPVMHRSWFNETASLSPWRHIPCGYIQLSPLYAASGLEAEQLGWPVVRLQGTHLHPVLEPEQTAQAISHVVTLLRGEA